MPANGEFILPLLESEPLVETYITHPVAPGEAEVVVVRMVVERVVLELVVVVRLVVAALVVVLGVVAAVLEVAAVPWRH